jgi:hypothetical protein
VINIEQLIEELRKGNTRVLNEETSLFLDTASPLTLLIVASVDVEPRVVKRVSGDGIVCTESRRRMTYNRITITVDGGFFNINFKNCNKMNKCTREIAYPTWFDGILDTVCNLTDEDMKRLAEDADKRIETLRKSIEMLREVIEKLKQIT